MSDLSNVTDEGEGGVGVSDLSNVTDEGESEVLV